MAVGDILSQGGWNYSGPSCHIPSWDILHSGENSPQSYPFDSYVEVANEADEISASEHLLEADERKGGDMDC